MAIIAPEYEVVQVYLPAEVEVPPPPTPPTWWEKHGKEVAIGLGVVAVGVVMPAVLIRRKRKR